MEFQNNNGGDVKNGAAKENNNAAQNSAAKTNGTAAKAANGNGTGEVKDTKPAPGNEEKPAQISQKPKAEEPKKEEPKAGEQKPVEEAKPVKSELTLEAKLKAVEDLHRKSVQRINLISRMQQLESFEVVLQKENDELEDNPYQGCKLIIEDDKRRQFITTTPGLIRMVSQFIFDACNLKLAEIESTINFPTAA
jgi:hypothetical protein